MSNLIITMISIALAVIIASMGGMYINQDAFKMREYKHSVETGFVKLKVGYDMHLSYRGSILPIATWKADIVKFDRKISVPKDIQGGYSWSYNKVGNRYYFCLSGNYKEVAYDGFRKVITDSSIRDVDIFINTTCGATSEGTESAIFTANTMAMTYWLSK